MTKTSNTQATVRVGLANCGPHTSCVLLGLWAEGKMELTIREYRILVKNLSMFLEELEEIRGELDMERDGTMP